MPAAAANVPEQGWPQKVRFTAHAWFPREHAERIPPLCRQDAYAVRGKEPVEDEVQIYTWMDATLRELSDLIKEASPAARERNSQLSFAIVYPGAPHAQDAARTPLGRLSQRRRAEDADKRGTMTLKEVGITHSLRRGGDDEKTLASLHFQAGDYMDCAVLSF